MKNKNILIFALITILLLVAIACKPPQPAGTPDQGDRDTEITDQDTNIEADPEGETDPEGEAGLETEPIDEDPDIEGDGTTTSISEDGETISITHEDGETIVISESGEGEETTIVTTENNGEVTVTDADGSVVKVTTDLPEGWPDDVPLMDGFIVVIGIETESASDEEGLTFTAGGNASYDEVNEFYTNALEGWEKSEITFGDMPTNSTTEMSRVIVFNRGAEFLNVVISSAEDHEHFETTLQLTYIKD